MELVGRNLLVMCVVVSARGSNAKIIMILGFPGKSQSFHRLGEKFNGLKSNRSCCSISTGLPKCSSRMNRNCTFLSLDIFFPQHLLSLTLSVTFPCKVLGGMHAPWSLLLV